jgi:hypothetical protein
MMIHDASTDDWERRQRAQAAAFDAIGARYDEAFPHKDGQVRAVEQLLWTPAASRSALPAAGSWPRSPRERRAAASS